MSTKLDTSLYDVAYRISDRLQELFSEKPEIKALGHRVELRDPKVYIDLYTRGRYTLMRVYGDREARGLLAFRPARLVEGITRYMVIVPRREIKELEITRRGRLGILGKARYKSGLYYIVAHRSHVFLAQQTVRNYFSELRDDALFYGLFDLSGRTPAFNLRKTSIEEANGCLEASGAGTVSAILAAYSIKEDLEREREEILDKIVSIARINSRRRQRKRRRSVFSMRVIKLLKRGAESRVYLIERFGLKAVKKERISKRYMHPKLDSRLRRQRTISEARTMHRVKSYGVNCPYVYDVDLDSYTIVMEYLEGPTIDKVREANHRRSLGSLVGILHEHHEVHGDLNVSNVIVSKEPYLIDFGLSYSSSRIEDKADDLHTLRRSMLHMNANHLREAFLEGYREAFSRADAVIKREEEIRLRGRYRKRGVRADIG